MLNTDNKRFFEWYWNNPSENDKSLYDMVCNFGPLFEDMTFQPGTSSYAMIQCKSQNPDSGTWEDDEAPMPFELEYFSYQWFLYKVEELPDCEGYFSGEEQVLCIDPKSMDDASILHEMIHLHEYMLNELPLFFHDTLLWSLYSDLKEKIPDLDEIITSHAHILTEWSLYKNGGNHDILFLLKSFDLDIQKGYPLGTVFAYGRADNFKGYTYKED